MNKNKKIKDLDTAKTYKNFCKIFYNDYHIDCYDLYCELRDCCECPIFKELYQEYLEELLNKSINNGSKKDEFLKIITQAL